MSSVAATSIQGPYFRDFYEMLSSGYRTYRIVKDGLREIGKYSELLEVFTCTNYLFIRR